MLSDVWKKKLAENVEKMIVMRQTYPDKYKHVFGYKEMAEENKHLEAQINRYKNLLGNGNSSSETK